MSEGNGDCSLGGPVNIQEIGNEYATGAYETGGIGLTEVMRKIREKRFVPRYAEKVFATGPRIKIRLFAGYDYEESGASGSLRERRTNGRRASWGGWSTPVLVASALRDQVQQRCNACKL